MTIERTCQFCGDPFTLIGRTAPKRPAIFCSLSCSNKARSRPGKDKFWEKVNKTDTCWLWTGKIARDGYGYLRDQAAHRVSWELHNGPVPEGKWVLHHCDIRPCVNPSHLFLGSRQDNMDDMSMKGRAGKKLTAEDVRVIRAAIA